MENRNNFEIVLERLLEAEQLMRIGIERGYLSSIERDILLEKLRGSYEQLLFDKLAPSLEPQLNQELTPKKEKEKKEELLPEKENPVEITVDQTENPTDRDTDSSISFEEEEKSSPVDTQKEEELSFVEGNDQQNNPATKGNNGNGYIKEKGSPILAEKFQGKRKFRNESLGASKSDVSSKLQNKPIYDLTKAIGINDKFLFTKELFGGNAEVYSRTIRKLNEFTDINDALIFIQENFQWDDNNQAASQLIDLVRRKLMIG